MSLNSISPGHFLCPISGKIMTDPVITPDGNTYDRKSFFHWFKSVKSTLKLNHVIEVKLISNNILKLIIDKYLENALKQQEMYLIKGLLNFRIENFYKTTKNTFY